VPNLAQEAHKEAIDGRDFQSFPSYDKVRQSLMSKAKRGRDQSQARIKPFPACDWSVLCFALL